MLLLSMYPLDAGAWGPTMRITNLRDELAKRVRLDVIHGYRPQRRLRLLRYAASGRLRRLSGIYVESSSFLPAEADVAFLGLARALGIPVVTYFRDAYQLFPEYYPIDSARRWLAARAFLPAMRALGRVSSRVAVPSPGLGAVLFGDRQALLIPPGAPRPVTTPYDPGARQLLYVGDARLAAQGADRLVAAVGRARDAGANVALTIVTRPGQEPPGPAPEWLRIERGGGDEIRGLLPDMAATVIPRPRGPYNDLALPIKLFEYLSYRRPLLVTPCIEQARIVESTSAGVVVPDDVAGMGAAIADFMALPAAQREAMAEAAGQAATAAAWSHRARNILDALGTPADRPEPRDHVE